MTGKTWVRGKLGQAGQSTLEFALVLFLLMAFLLFYVQLALMMGYGNYAHYATFMAARAYLSAGPDPTDQKQRAQTVIVRMIKKGQGQEGIDRFPSIAQATGDGDIKGVQIGAADNFSSTDKHLSWLQGVRYAFKSRLFLLPFGTAAGAAAAASASSVTLKSESWLGREPAYNDCQQDIGAKKGIFDNGC
jgi:hypothetical protein